MMQIMSITETQWSNSSVIIISPDSDCLSVLQAAVLGTDLRNHAQVSSTFLSCPTASLRMSVLLDPHMLAHSCQPTGYPAADSLRQLLCSLTLNIKGSLLCTDC